MFAPHAVGSTGYEDRLQRRDGAYTVLHRHGAPPPEAAVWTPSPRAPAWPAPVTAHDGATTRRVFPFAKVPHGGCPIGDRLALLTSDDVTLSWVSADSATDATLYTDHDGDQLVCVLEGGATLDTPCGTLRANPAEHVFVPRGMAHRWKVDKLGLRALVVAVRGELSVPARYRNGYGQPADDAPFTPRDLHRAGWFSRPPTAPAPLPCAMVRGGERLDGSVAYDPLATVGWEGAVYPASLAWEVPLVKSPPAGVELFGCEQLSIRTRITRDDVSPAPFACDLATLCLDGDGAASLVWEPLGVAPRPAGTVGGIVVQVCARRPLSFAANGAVLVER